MIGPQLRPFQGAMVIFESPGKNMSPIESVLSSERLRRAARFIAVVAIALAAGHLVQTLAARKSVPPTQSSLKTLEHVVQLSAAPDAAELTPPVHATATLTQAPMPAQGNCAPTMQLVAEAGAVVLLRVSAPCDAGAEVVMHHAGLAISERIGSTGQLALRLPALDAAGRFSLQLPDGREASAALPLADLATVRRFVVQWSGKAGFILHGMENGATFGGAGDVSPGQPGTPGAGGWISLLGDATVDAPLMAQIYTYPAAPATTEVVVEAPVSSASCGRVMRGQTILSTAGAARVTGLSLTMPDCSAVGDFLVLKNLDLNVTLVAN